MKKLLGSWMLIALLGLVARAQMPEEFKVKDLDEPPRAKRQIAPVYPFWMRKLGLEGRVTVEFIVDKEGHVVAAQVVRSNNPWLERPALDAITRWTFSPGRKGGRAVNTRCQIDMPFTLQGGGEGLWSVTKPKNQDTFPKALQWDIAPEPLNTAFPVYPFDDLMKGTAGKVKVSFIVGTDGRVIVAKTIEATTPEMASAALAAIDAWEFRPARKQDGTRCGAALGLAYDFDVRAGDVPVSESAQDILRALRKDHGAKFATLNELDAVPRPLSRRSPVYPSALRAAGQDGEAMIEFFIDENGDAQLPRIVSATAPAFGWAAAQAVATWRFTGPERKGKSVVARAQIPIHFTLHETKPDDGAAPAP